MKLAIIGSRTFNDYAYMKKILKFHPCKQIISGGTRGADRLAKRYAGEHSIPIQEFLPNWDLHGKSAGYIRNEQIVEISDEIVAFWDGISKETKHTLYLAEIAGKPIYIYWPNEETSEWIEQIGL